jgi:hypothetical protein
LIIFQILTLFTTPVVYLAFDRFVRRAGMQDGEAGSPLPQPAE